MQISPTFLLKLLRSHNVSPDRGYAKAIRSLDWIGFDRASSTLSLRAKAAVRSPDELAQALREHARAEESGADVIENVANSVTNETLSQLMLTHAADERRHHKIFLALGELSAAPREDLQDCEGSPDPFIAEYDGEIADFICDTHIAEIRNIAYLTELESAVAASPWPAAGRIASGLAGILRDERRHVALTGTILCMMFRDIPDMDRRLALAFEAYRRSIEAG